ncbi:MULTISPECIES: hypothetical protein [unclassified Micromonospora]|uniref:hypothetical protein n=1 Tax=unclassified Micromonospora TaxID=2617518 RepID=UPI001C5E0807|nr:hypothetical protein [Micromonospora sp. RL09-050-HVF-A]MBW4705395.1 hypothetical protein [Micromonospora sp. RL09-050-HVF-A]
MLCDPAPALAPLAARWVAWVAAHRQPVNPVKDDTGRHGGRHQPDDVWFLAGTFGGGVSRRCVVPAGRPLFFPAFSYWQPGRRDEPAEPMPDASGHAELDGAAVPVRPAGSAASFPVRGFFNNVVTTWPWPVQVSCWGLWGLVPPPTPGTHRLTFAGHDGARFWVEAEYELDVR